MKFSTRVQVLALGIGSLLPRAIAAQQMPASPPVLRVSVFDDAGVGIAALRKAEREASRVFRRANIEVIWLECPQNSSEQISFGRCSEVSFPEHLVLRIARRSRDAKKSTLGMSFQSGDGKGCYVDLFYEPTLELKTESRIGAAIILGHAMAHELGHLLLGTNSHSPDGLMRAHWEPGELAQAAKGNLLFSAEESKRMRVRFTRDDSVHLADLVRGK
jgi:hypothetical protein